MIRKGLTNRLRVRVFAPALGALVTLGIICTNRIPATKADDGAGTAGGEYPECVAILGNGTAFVASVRDRGIVVVDISTNQPIVTGRVSLKGQPTRVALNPWLLVGLRVARRSKCKQLRILHRPWSL